jgi:hypothetical protein
MVLWLISRPSLASKHDRMPPRTEQSQVSGLKVLCIMVKANARSADRSERCCNRLWARATTSAAILGMSRAACCMETAFPGTEVSANVVRGRQPPAAADANAAGTAARCSWADPDRRMSGQPTRPGPSCSACLDPEFADERPPRRVLGTGIGPLRVGSSIDSLLRPSVHGIVPGWPGVTMRRTIRRCCLTRTGSPRTTPRPRACRTCGQGRRPRLCTTGLIPHPPCAGRPLTMADPGDRADTGAGWLRAEGCPARAAPDRPSGPGARSGRPR